MKTTSFLRYLLPVVLLTSSAAFASQSVSDKAVKLSGTFVWTGHTKDQQLDATLTPSGTNQWAAAFSFLWDKKPHTWNGTLKGRLDNGDVSGEVTADGGHRTFQLQGKVVNGQLMFSHCETTGGKTVSTGTGVLKPATDKPGAVQKS